VDKHAHCGGPCACQPSPPLSIISVPEEITLRCRRMTATMETMTASFSARPSVRLDNMIVYSGLPAGKNQKNQPPRPAPTSQVRDDSLPAGTIRTGRAGVVENGSGSSTSNVDSKLPSHQCWTGQADSTHQTTTISPPTMLHSPRTRLQVTMGRSIRPFQQRATPITQPQTWPSALPYSPICGTI